MSAAVWSGAVRPVMPTNDNSVIVATQRTRTDSTSLSSREVLPSALGEGRARLSRHWMARVIRRIVELDKRTEGWDSYGGGRLQPSAIEVTLKFLVEYGYAIQTEPLLSLTGEGGLLCAWQSSQGVLDLTAQPDETPSVYYCDAVTGREWEGSVYESSLLEKWLWRASADS